LGEKSRAAPAFGAYDAVSIHQLPDQASAAALSRAASAEGAVRTIKTTRLMTVEERLDALRKAAVAHENPTSYSSPSAGPPLPRVKPVDYQEILSSRLQKFKRRRGKIVTGR
jgi:GYD domain